MSGQRIDNAINAVDQLRQRIACNRSSSCSFSDFVLQVLSPRGDDVALDIGPGLGSQLLPVADRVARAVGLDVSAEAVAELRARLAESRAAVIQGNMDDLATLDLGAPAFSLVYAIYSLYYSGDPARVVRRVAALLRGEHARFVCINPDVGNNETWFADLRQLFELPADVVGVPHVGSDVILPACLDSFRTVECISYEDRIRFPTLDALMVYYDACAPYCRPDERAAVQRYFGAKIERDGGYEIPKRSLALVGRF
jgi:hypothetical protein